MAEPFPTQGDTSFSVLEPEKTEVPFDINVYGMDAPSPPLDQEVSYQRSFKMKYGLDTILKESRDEIFGKINAGEENTLRTMAAAELDRRKQEQTEIVIQKVIGAKGGPLTTAEALGLTSILDNMTEKTDPRSVVEEAYGKQFMANLDTAISKNPNSAVSDVRQKSPEAIARLQQGHSSLIAKREYANTLAEDIDAEIKHQGWVPYIADTAKSFVPGYTDIKLRNNAEVGFTTGTTLGGNLEAQRLKLLGLPFPEFKAQLTAIATRLRADNPQMASEFVKSVVGMSSDELFIRSAVLPLDLAGLGIGKASLKAVRGVSKLTDGALQAKKAADDIALAAADPAASRSTIQAASGDLKESAITRTVADRIGGNASGEANATANSVEALVESQRADLALVKSNPGKYGQDIVNRIAEQSETITTSFINAVKNISKVERLPEIMSNEVAVRAILDYTKNSYRDLANSVIHMSKPYKEPIANTYLTDMHIGNVDGTYFKSKEVAENFAEVHGLKSRSIVEGTDEAFTPKSVRVAKYDKEIRDTHKLIERETAKLNDEKLTDAQRAKAGEQITIAEEYIVDQAMARRALQQTVTVEQQGLGYYVKVTKPIDETSSVVRSFIAETTNTKIPNSPLQQFLNGSIVGKLRTPEETLSLAERQNRLASTYSPSIYFEVMQNNAPTLNKLFSGTGRFGKGRKRREEFQRVLEAGQRMKDPDSIEEMGGYYFKSPQELEEHYLRINNRLPDKDEIVAYFEFKRGMEMDRAFRNIAEHRNQQRVGAETHRIGKPNPDGTIDWSPEFSGVTRNKLHSADDNMLIVNTDGTMRMISLQATAKSAKDELQQEIDKGMAKMIELYAPEHRPLAGWGDVKESNRVRYVLSRESEVRELDWNQVARRGGGHMEYDYDYYIKQAKVMFDDIGNRAWYEGDITVMPIQVRAMGVKVAQHLNEVRKLLKAKDEAGAQAYSNKNLHIDWDMVSGWFKPGTDAAGKRTPARLSLDEPIQVLRRGESIADVDKELERRYTNFKNGQKEGSLSRQNQVEFNRERDSTDLITLTDEGTRKNPLYKVAPAALVDPITTMNRGLARIAKSNFLDDYKTMSVEHWLKQAAKYLKATDSEIWHSPFYHFNNPEFKPNAPAEIKSALETARFHTQQLTGTPSTTDAVLHTYAQRTYDFLYEKFGTKGLVVDPAWMLPKLKDPFGFIRSIVFNAKLGLFNIPQFVVQAGNYSNILGIAGARYATPGTYAAQLHFWSTVNSNPAIIKHLDNLATKMRIPGTSHWKPGEFAEAMAEGKRTGFFNVGSEYAILDNPMSEKVVQDGVNKFLDWGQFFFKQGEKNAKMGAWYTAYKEFRDKVPVGRLTDADRAAILQRADLLNVNMSRASSSAIHQGVWSIPTQFYTYQIRLMELFFGSRLTGVERGRMLATNAAMYGIPMAAGLTGIPAADYLRNKALENGYIVGDNLFTTMLAEGIPSAIIAMASGGGDIQKGTVYDIGNRFGTKGLEFLGGLDRADKGYLDIVGGAAYSMAKSTWESSDGLRRAMWALAKGDPELYPATYEDGLDIAKEISLIKGVSQSWVALRTGVWTSKKEAYLADNITPTNAIVNLLVGVKPQQITDINTLQNALKHQAESERLVEKQFAQEFKRGVLEMQSGDSDRAQYYFNRARTIVEWADFPEDRITDMVNKAIGDDRSLLAKTNFDKFIKKAPASRTLQGVETIRKLNEMKDKRGEQ